MFAVTSRCGNGDHTLMLREVVKINFEENHANIRIVLLIAGFELASSSTGSSDLQHVNSKSFCFVPSLPLKLQTKVLFT